ncbi:NAD(P)/FAD-dependent oxidoreductase [Flavihumibacter rivuli]|uniref:NAD(P)/FAD-dependent oxidoreductase n=1 Tax=Flavihumibacter rivuli TaxID=2838156 RepID=UPI001BDE3D06|nr:NAD(P)/FAD-dependent oxidoreductase [Flavihumibacter rivuli]ULQ56485.1 NAD(P)/FAD-dependent oxidoreductase [Flavihumibacter rivuli]
MINNQPYDVAVIGGGLAGLASAILLSRAGHRVVLFERHQYPFHRVCGEYISEESRPFLAELGVPVNVMDLPAIRRLLVSAPSGFSVAVPLEMGGFGISRYQLDALLAQEARVADVELLEGVKVDSIEAGNELSHIHAGGHQYPARVVIGSQGKRSNLDRKLGRDFVQRKAGKLDNYIGVKYHIRYDMESDLIALHNFRNGYCGISKVEGDKYCLCYLSSAINLGLCNNSIPLMEKEILSRNPHLARIFNEAEFLWKQPLSISQVSFAAKEQVREHILMVGDAAGLITPLCGNGMSMALHAAKLVANEVGQFLSGTQSRRKMEEAYQKKWQEYFSGRLKAGRTIQRFFGSEWLTEGFLRVIKPFPALVRQLERQTHGQVF